MCVTQYSVDWRTHWTGLLDWHIFGFFTLYGWILHIIWLDLSSLTNNGCLTACSLLLNTEYGQ